jgi:outer membrane protein assembly factor BamB
VADDDPQLPAAWSRTEGLVWQVRIPGLGWSSPIIWGDRVFVTSAEEEGGAEEPKKGLYLGGERPAPQRQCRWWLHCVDFRTGARLWSRQAAEGVPQAARHLKNSYASETPVTDGQRVYAYFGNVGLFAYDMSGQLLWSRTWDRVATRAGWGTAASPVLHGDCVYVVNDNETRSWLAAVSVETGQEKWRSERAEKSNWSTPFVWENEQRTEIVTPGSGRTRSYDLNGNLLWELSGASGITIPTPCAKYGLLYVSSGFVMSPRQPLWAIRPGGTGDISLKPGEDSSPAIAWCRPRAAPYNTSPLVYGDLVYVLLDRGQLSCYDARTGEVRYEHQRLPTGSAYTASPWGYNGQVFCLSEDGDTQVVEAGPEYRFVRTNRLGEMCLATPAMANGSLILRTVSTLYRIEQRPAP